MQKNTIRGMEHNNLLKIIAKLTDEEKRTLEAMTATGVQTVVLSQKLDPSTLKKVRDSVFLTVCAAYVYGSKKVFEELDKL